MLTGGCFCGRIRYEVRGAPFNATICHCIDCRRAAGAPAVAWFSAAPNDLVFVAGASYRFASSAGVTRAFCRDCGTPLTYARADRPDEIDLTTATLDDPEQVPPQDQTFARHRLWAGRDIEMPAYSGARG